MNKKLCQACADMVKGRRASSAPQTVSVWLHEPGHVFDLRGDCQLYNEDDDMHVPLRCKRRWWYPLAWCIAIPMAAIGYCFANDWFYQRAGDIICDAHKFEVV